MQSLTPIKKKYFLIPNNSGNFFVDGQKVILNVDRIKSHKDYPILQKRYQEWVEEHENCLFTVQNEERTYPFLVSLVEDETSPQWLFSTYDLIQCVPKEAFRRLQKLKFEKDE